MSPVPAEIDFYQPAVGYQVRIGEKVGEKGIPKPTDYFVIKQMEGTKEVATHPLTNDRLKELDVMLISDRPEGNFKDGIAFWDGVRPACYNWEGGDEAFRRNLHGVYVSVACDRTRCPMWLNQHGNDPSAARFLADSSRAGPGTPLRENWPTITFTKDSGCKLQFFLWMELPGLTAAGEVAQFYTQSPNTYRQIKSAMATIAGHTNGILRGIPLKLKIVMRRDTHGGYKPTVTLIAGSKDITEFNQMVLGAVERRQLSGMNWKVMEDFISIKALADATGQDNEFIAEHWANRSGDDAEFDAGTPNSDVRMLAGGQEEYKADPTQAVASDIEVIRLAQQLGLNRGQINALALKHGDDVQAAIDDLRGRLPDEDADLEEVAEEPGPDDVPAPIVDAPGPAAATSLGQLPLDAQDDPPSDADEFGGI